MALPSQSGRGGDREYRGRPHAASRLVRQLKAQMGTQKVGPRSQLCDGLALQSRDALQSVQWVQLMGYLNRNMKVKHPGQCLDIISYLYVFKRKIY